MGWNLWSSGCVHIRGKQKWRTPSVWFWLAGWLGSDQWQLGLESLKSKARAHCHLLHSCPELSPSPPVQALTLKDHPPEQNIKLLPNHSLSNHLPFKVQIQRAEGVLERRQGGTVVYVPAAVSERGHREGSFSESFSGRNPQSIQRQCVCALACAWFVPYRTAPDSGVPCAPVWQW